MAGKPTMRLKWVRSAICAPLKHKKVVKGLGFTRLNQVIVREDTPSIRGMVAKVPHLLVVGKREAEEGTVAVRRLGSDEHQKMMSVDEALDMIRSEAVPPDVKQPNA